MYFKPKWLVAACLGTFSKSIVTKTDFWIPNVLMQMEHTAMIPKYPPYNIMSSNINILTHQILLNSKIAYHLKLNSSYGS